MTKDTTRRIKGVAILIMIAHHFLCYDFGVNFPVFWKAIGAASKICVGIYAVLSGYGYFYAKGKTLKYVWIEKELGIASRILDQLVHSLYSLCPFGQMVVNRKAFAGKPFCIGG